MRVPPLSNPALESNRICPPGVPPLPPSLPAGNMKRSIDVYSAASGWSLAAQLSGEAMTAIASRTACHPALPVLAGATNSGRLHIYR